jgi:hypothetical protein
MRLGKRKERRDWKPRDVISDVEAAFFGDANKRTVRAAAIVRNAYERMTKKEVTLWEADAATESPSGLRSHAVFLFDFDEVDRPTLYMDGDRSVLIRTVQPADGIADGRAVALDWVGKPSEETDITHIPGAYQAALIEFVTGVERLWNQEALGWWLPHDGPGPPYVFRNYPPNTDEDAAEFKMMAMPESVKRDLYLEFLRSPSVDAELKRSKRRLRLR